MNNIFKLFGRRRVYLSHTDRLTYAPIHQYFYFSLLFVPTTTCNQKAKVFINKN